MTQYDTEVYNDNGFTTGLTLKAWSQCEVDIYTGIARFVYEAGLVIQMFSYNSLGQTVSLGRIANGQIVYWYKSDGKALTRKFVMSNPSKYPISFRITI